MNYFRYKKKALAMLQDEDEVYHQIQQSDEAMNSSTLGINTL